VTKVGLAGSPTMIDGCCSTVLFPRCLAD
jgi:hypothetical protein